MKENKNIPDVNWDQLVEMLDSNSAEDSFAIISPEEEQVLSDLKQIKGSIAASGKFEQLDEDAQWNKFTVKRNAALGKVIAIPLWRRVSKYAAVAVLVLVAGAAAYYFTYKKSAEKTIQTADHTIKPNDNDKVRLILSDGNEIVLNKKEKVQSKDGLILNNQQLNELQYADVKPSAAAEVYNTLIIPKGETYKIVLADGSRVWLNSDSRLRFPVNFTGEDRNVYLEGEAYLEVAKDKAKPFFVHTKDVDVKVLGTSFNVRAYTQNVQTTLLEGKVKVNSNSGESFLLPGQQSNYDAANNRLIVKEVNPDDFVAWKNGMICFSNTSLGVLMQDISRMYDYDVKYADEQLKPIKFSMNIEKQGDIEEVLSLIEKTSQLKFVINKKERIIVVKQK